MYSLGTKLASTTTQAQPACFGVRRQILSAKQKAKTMQGINKNKIILYVIIILIGTTLVVFGTGAVVRAMASSNSSAISFILRDGAPTPTPFQPANMAGLLGEDGIPQPLFTPTPVPIIPAGELPDEQVNILLLGQDDYEERNFRTDVIILLSINPKHETVTLISFPRDLYVAIPGFWSNRINTAWSLGGWDLLKQVFETNFGIVPDYYMMVHFDGFKAVVDSLDGIDVEITQTLSDSCHMDPSGWCTFEPGVMHMDGQTALWYSRSRMTSSDFDRNRRTQDVIVAMAKKAMSRNMIIKIPELYGHYREYIDTDMPLSAVMKLMPMASKLKDFSNLRHFAVDSTMAYDWITWEGSMVLMPDNNAIARMLNEALYRNEQ